jgi:hypothetical protein
MVEGFSLFFHQRNTVHTENWVFDPAPEATALPVTPLKSYKRFRLLRSNTSLFEREKEGCV